MLPLIIFTILFGFCIPACGGEQSLMGRLLVSLSGTIMKFVGIIMLMAPIGLGAYFANLVVIYGPEIIGDYGHSMLVCYPPRALYGVIPFLLYVFLASGRRGVTAMVRNILRPAVITFATQPSATTILVNKEACDNTDMSKNAGDLMLPMGCITYMDGSVLSPITKIASPYGVFGMDFPGASAYDMVIVVAIPSILVLSGAPGDGLMGEVLIASIFNFPVETFPIVAILDFLLDPATTCLNASGGTIASMLATHLMEGKGWLAKVVVAKKDQA